MPSAKRSIQELLNPLEKHTKPSYYPPITESRVMSMAELCGTETSVSEVFNTETVSSQNTETLHPQIDEQPVLDLLSESETAADMWLLDALGPAMLHPPMLHSPTTRLDAEPSLTQSTQDYDEGEILSQYESAALLDSPSRSESAVSPPCSGPESLYAYSVYGESRSLSDSSYHESLPEEVSQPPLDANALLQQFGDLEYAHIKTGRLKHTLQPRNIYHVPGQDRLSNQVVAEVEKERVLCAVEKLTTWSTEEKKRIRREQADELGRRKSSPSLPPRFMSQQLSRLFIDRDGKHHPVKLYGTCTYSGILFDAKDVANAFFFTLKSIMRKEAIEYIEGTHYLFCTDHSTANQVMVLTLAGFEMVLHNKVKIKFNGRIYLLHVGNLCFKYGYTGDVSLRKQSLRTTTFRGAPKVELVYSVGVFCRSLREGEELVEKCLVAFHNHLPRDKDSNMYESTELCKLTTLKDFDRLIDCMNAQQQEYIHDRAAHIPFDRSAIMRKLHEELHGTE